MHDNRGVAKSMSIGNMGFKMKQFRLNLVPFDRNIQRFASKGHFNISTLTNSLTRSQEHFEGLKHHSANHCIESVNCQFMNCHLSGSLNSEFKSESSASYFKLLSHLFCVEINTFA